MFLLHTVENGTNIAFRVRYFLSSDNTFEYFVLLRLTLVIDDTWTVDQINALGECDVLPHFSLTWDWGHLATRLLHE